MHRARIFVGFVVAMGLPALVAVAQKPPSPAPAPAPPPVAAPNAPTAPISPMSQPTQPATDLVMFLSGHVVTQDGARVPYDATVERVCDGRVRQQVPVSPSGDFSMQLGSTADSFLDATGDWSSPNRTAAAESRMGIPRRELLNCELRASISGFSSAIVSLMNLDSRAGTLDVGSILVRRRVTMEGMTLSALPYKAPKDARRAYETGFQDARHGKLAEARRNFEKAVEIYPGFALAWFQLGTILRKQEQLDPARAAFTRAMNVDNGLLPPYLSLSEMALEAHDWAEVVKLTNHISDRYPLDHVDGYILDLDSFDYAAAYFYNSLANYRLNRIDDAEKSGIKAEHLDLRNHFPQVHLLLAEISARKNNYTVAVAELQTYLAAAPHAQDAPQIRQRLTEFEKRKSSESTREQTGRN